MATPNPSAPKFGWQQGERPSVFAWPTYEYVRYLHSRDEFMTDPPRLEHPSTTMSNKDPATIKTRHYAALAASLRQLNSNLAQSESDYQRLAERLQAMQRLGAYHAAQSACAHGQQKVS